MSGIDWAAELTAPKQAEPQQGGIDWVAEMAGGSKAAPAPQSDKEGWGEWAVKLPYRAYKAAKGTHDPAYKDLKAFDDTPGASSGEYKVRATVGAVGGMSDESYGDIIQKSLGKNFIRRFKDANGYEIVEHLGPDGKPTQAYVNKPGLDLQDVSRGVAGALPYVVGGTWLGGLRGATTFPGIVAQSGLAGMTSVAGDAATAGAGGNQGADLGKAAVTAGAAGAGAALTPAIGALWRRFVTVPGLVDANGKLTAKGIEAAKRAGIDDASALEGALAKEFASTYAKTGDAAAAALQAESRAYGVETTLGQRTKDPMQLLREKGMRMGNYGDAAKQQVTELDRRQADQIERMVRGNAVPNSATKVEPSMLERLAPNKPYIDTRPEALGKEIQTGVQSARGAAKSEAGEAWKEVPNLVPRQEAFSDLAPLVTNKLGTRRLSTSTPKAMEMDAALDAYTKGEVVASGTKLVNQSPIQTVDDMRRHLKDMLFAVDKSNDADRAAAKAIYDGYNEWVMSSAKKSLLNGEADKAANLFKAVDLTKEMHAIFRPTGQNFQRNSATRVMETVLNDATPEKIVSTLFGSGKGQIKDGAVQALTLIKRGLDRYSPQNAAETWNTIRAAHWSRLIEGADGKLLSPTVIRKNIDSALSSQSSLMRVLYTNDDRKEMMRIARVLGGVSWKDPNPSGTATAAQGLMREFFTTLFKALPIGNTAKMALEFSGIPARARNAAGFVGAQNATSQTLPALTNEPMAGYASGAANALYNNR